MAPTKVGVFFSLPEKQRSEFFAVMVIDFRLVIANVYKGPNSHTISFPVFPPLQIFTSVLYFSMKYSSNLYLVWGKDSIKDKFYVNFLNLLLNLNRPFSFLFFWVDRILSFGSLLLPSVYLVSCLFCFQIWVCSLINFLMGKLSLLFTKFSLHRWNIPITRSFSLTMLVYLFTTLKWWAYSRYH